MFSALFSWLTGGGKTADKVIDTVSAGVDMAWFTEEEKSIAAAKVLDFKLKWMKATSGQNLARRVIAFGVVGLWILIIVIACFARIWSVDASNFLFQVLTDIVSLPFTVIIGFYFAAHMVGKLKE
jgi:ABC-type transport system involved in cytochrome c biogenesis permease subunit